MGATATRNEGGRKILKHAFFLFLILFQRQFNVQRRTKRRRRKRVYTRYGALCGVFKIYGWRMRKLLHFTPTAENTKIRNKQKPAAKLEEGRVIHALRASIVIHFIQICDHHHHCRSHSALSQVNIFDSTWLVPNVNCEAEQLLASIHRPH